MAGKILDTYYVTRTEDELEHAIREIIIGGKDSKKEKRRQLLSKEFPNIGNAGKYICSYLKQLIEE